MKINFMESGIQRWMKWKDIEECSLEEIKQANLRQLKPDEIVLDADKQTLSELIKKLEKHKFEYQAYQYGKPTGHAHLTCPELTDYEEDDRVLIRKIMIDYFGCDLKLASENHMIAWENKPHWKTGEIKKRVAGKPGTMKIPEFIIEKFHKKKAKITPPIDIEELENGVAEGKRNWAAIVLATYYRRLGWSQEWTLEKIKEINQRNKPPCPENELEATVRGAFKVSPPYKYKIIQLQKEGNKVSRLLSYVNEIAVMFHDQFKEGHALVDKKKIIPVRSREMRTFIGNVFWKREKSL